MLHTLDGAGPGEGGRPAHGKLLDTDRKQLGEGDADAVVAVLPPLPAGEGERSIAVVHSAGAVLPVEVYSPFHQRLLAPVC